MASYDYQNHGCYVLEAGDYIISTNSDSHNVLDSKTYTVASDIVYNESNKRESDAVAATNQFDFAEGEITYLSRADGFANYAEATAAPADYNMSDEVKAVFDNPDNVLIPGLYATVVSDTQVQRNALAVPQRAVQQTLGKYYITVIDGNGQAQTKEVTPGQKVGNFWIITSGLNDGDTIIVDGYQKAKGAARDQNLLTKAELEKESTAATTTSK